MDSSSLPQEDIEVETNVETEEIQEDMRFEKSRGKRKEAPGQSRGSSKAAKTKEERERSYVWDHFTRVKGNDNRSKCHYCGKTFACPTSSGTSNLGKHLNTCKPFLSWQESKSQQIITDDGCLRVAKVSEAVVREATNEMLVLGELPLSFVECIAWRHFTSKINLYKPHSRRTATRDIYEMFVQRKTEMKKWIAATKQRVSLTTDIWVASATGASYMVITLHFVDQNWHLRKLIIGFKYVVDHKGATIASVLLDCLADWGIDKIFTITCDNATTNTSALQKFQRQFKLLGPDALILDGDFMHMRCCAHIINLIVGDGLHDVRANVEAIWNAVTYVRSSTKRLISFDQKVDEAKISRGSLPLDCKTRWNSTYLMLTKAQKFRVAFDKMEAEDRLFNDYFLEVENGKKRTGPPTFTDWVGIERLVRFLHLFYKSTLVVSASTSVNSHRCYGEIVTIEKNLTLMSTSSDPDMKDKATKMKEKFDKYWDGFGQINKLLVVASVFDPTKKLQFAQLCFDKLYGRESTESKVMYESVYSVLRSLFKEYNRVYPRKSMFASASGINIGEQDQAPTGADGDIEDLVDEAIICGYESMEKQYNEMVDEVDLHEVRDELDIYLKDKVENPKSNLFGSDFDLLAWWRRNSGKFPVLSEIARDVLAMQVSSVASESAFSTSGRVIAPSRSCLSHYSIEVLMCTEQWMKSEIQSKEMGAQTNAQLLADFELQDELEKEFETHSTPRV